MTAIPVTVDNFRRVETDTMIARSPQADGGLGAFRHDRQLASLDQQPVIRMNRDTLYSTAVVDLAEDATLTIPEAGNRYLSVMVINQDHYINRVYHHAGSYTLSRSEFGTDYVVVTARILFDPTSDADLQDVHRLQDGLTLAVAPQRAFVRPDYDPVTHKEVRDALLTLGRGIGGFAGTFGSAAEVDPVRHLIGTAMGWGGLPDAEASYVNIDPRLPVGRYAMTFRDVPADAFWSLSVYDADGYFDPGPSGLTNVNSVFAQRSDDGSITIHLGDFGPDVPNRIPLPEGWNLLVRLYRPRLQELATWRPPDIQPV